MNRTGFGTDGWRGVIADDFTVDNLRKVVRAVALYIIESGAQGPVVVGFDTRFMSEYYAMAAAEVVCAYGLKAVVSSSAVTTPMLSSAVLSSGSSGGIMVTASHNPSNYNGIKFKAPYGGSAHTGITRQIESKIGDEDVRTVSYTDALRDRCVTERDFLPEYESRLLGALDTARLGDSGYRVLFDCMHGPAGVHVPGIFGRLGVDAEFMRTSRDPYFGGCDPEPMEKNLGGLISAMSGGGYDIGFATDGDGDRLGVVAPDGRYVGPHLVAGLIALHLARNRGLDGAIARTVSMSSVMDRIAESLGLEVVEKPVGFKNICELMLDGGILIGCEENGGIGVKGYMPDRDGLLGALLLLEMMAVEGRGIIELLDGLEAEFGGTYYERCDIPLAAGVKDMGPDNLMQSVKESFGSYGIIRISQLDGLKAYFEDGSWILFRRSGTESVMRVYCESGSPDTLRALVKRAMEVLIG